MTRVRAALLVALLTFGLLLAGSPASAARQDNTVPGYGVETVSVLPANVLPGSTVSATLTLSQTTAYPLRCRPLVTILLGPVPTVAPVDITARVRDPRTGAWVEGVQQVFPYATSGEQVSFEFEDEFDLQPTEQLTVNVQITVGPAAPHGYYNTMIAVGALPVGADPGLSVLMESVRMYQSMRIGPPPTTDPPPPPNPPAATRPTGPAASPTPQPRPVDPTASPSVPANPAAPPPTAPPAPPAPPPAECGRGRDPGEPDRRGGGRPRCGLDAARRRLPAPGPTTARRRQPRRPIVID